MFVCAEKNSHVNFFKGGGRNLYVNGMWLVGRMMAILDLLSKVASGEAGCEGSLDKWCHLILQGNGGRSCLLLWNAKNVASPNHGPCHTYNAKWTAKGPSCSLFKRTNMVAAPQCLKLTTNCYHSSTHINRTAMRQTTRLLWMYAYLKAASNFCNYSGISFTQPAWEAWWLNFGEVSFSTESESGYTTSVGMFNILAWVPGYLAG